MIADVDVASPLVEYPVRQDNHVIYATGHYRTVLSGPELADAAERHAINKVYHYTLYHTAPIFTEYMQYMWSRRQQFASVGQTQQARWCKRLMNALYGKFGQRLPSWHPKLYETPPQPWSTWNCVYSDTGKVTTKRAIGWDVEESQDRLEHPDAMPMIAAFVTSYARLYMHALRWIAGPHNVYYQAADCLFVNAEGFKRLHAQQAIDREVLGKLRVENRYDNAEWHGVQHYRVGETWVRGPIQADAVSVGNSTYIQPTSEHLPSVVTREPDGTHRTIMHTQRLYGCGPRGLVGPDGWVRPYHLDCLSHAGGVSNAASADSIPTIDSAADSNSSAV
jgi:DNA polymerase type B, organellar and viral